MSSEVLTPPALRLDPLTSEQRVAIMQHARQLSADARRIFHRLLIVGQEHGLTHEYISHTAAQAREHAAAVPAV
jgi:hypothetical protein